jgi:hydroxyacyl-ACP dehydratase HTD2-like protein with hotdog domain
MIRSSQTPVGETVDLGWVEVDAATVESYWQAVGLPMPSAQRRLPLGLALALRGGPRPSVELAPETVSVHAGHSIIAHRPFAVERRYRVLARIAEVFEKSGRSGPLTVVVRTAELRDESDALVVAIREQQIARWRREAVPPPRHPTAHVTDPPRSEGPDQPLDIGSTIATERRRAPDAASVSAYAGSLGGAEPLFSDSRFARRLGYADVIVPGPIQSALLENLLARHLPEWDVDELSVSFRVSLSAGEPIALTALVTEIDLDATRLVADLTLENSSGERAAVGTANLCRAA